MVSRQAKRTRECLRDVVPPLAVPLVLSVFELQVNLCEWRKMLSVDTTRVVSCPLYLFC